MFNKKEVSTQNWFNEESLQTRKIESPKTDLTSHEKLPLLKHFALEERRNQRENE